MTFTLRVTHAGEERGTLVVDKIFKTVEPIKPVQSSAGVYTFDVSGDRAGELWEKLREISIGEFEMNVRI
jgi:hypothetical protein